MVLFVHVKLIMIRLSLLIFISLYLIFSSCFAQTEQELIEAVINKDAVIVHNLTPYGSALKSLNEQEKEIFYNKRNNILRSVAVSLNMIKYGFGAGHVVKEKLVFWKKSEEADQFKKTMKEVSHEIIYKILQAIDQQIHQQAKVFVSANEFGFLTSAHLIAEGYKANSPGKGGVFGLGLSIGYNFEQKMLIFEIYKESEKFKSSMMPAFFVGGLVGKIGTYMSYNAKNKLQNVGETFYPPGAPGFAYSNANKAAGGMSSGLTIPPFPFGDMLTYTNKGSQKSLIQIRISPLYKGYIRINSKLGSAAYNTLKMPVYKAQDLILKLKTNGKSNKCEMLFN